MNKKQLEHSIRQFGLYINGLRAPKDLFKLDTNPFNGKILGRVFLVPQDSLIFEEQTPTEEITAVD